MWDKNIFSLTWNRNSLCSPPSLPHGCWWCRWIILLFEFDLHWRDSCPSCCPGLNEPSWGRQTEQCCYSGRAWMKTFNMSNVCMYSHGKTYRSNRASFSLWQQTNWIPLPLLPSLRPTRAPLNQQWMMTRGLLGPSLLQWLKQWRPQSSRPQVRSLSVTLKQWLIVRNLLPTFNLLWHVPPFISVDVWLLMLFLAVTLVSSQLYFLFFVPSSYK